MLNAGIKYSVGEQKESFRRNMFSTCPKIILFDACAVSELELGQDSLLREKCVKAAGKQLVSV